MLNKDELADKKERALVGAYFENAEEISTSTRFGMICLINAINTQYNLRNYVVRGKKSG